MFHFSFPLDLHRPHRWPRHDPPGTGLVSFLHSSGSAGPSVSNRLSTSSFSAWPNAHQADRSDLDMQDLLDSDVKFMRVEGTLMESVTTETESVRALSVHGWLSCGLRALASCQRVQTRSQEEFLSSSYCCRCCRGRCGRCCSIPRRFK